MKHKVVYLTPCDVALVTKMANVTTITINLFDYVLPNLSTTPNSLFVSLQGKFLEMVAYDNIDLADNVGKFSVDLNNRLVFIVDSTIVTDNKTAYNYVWGYRVAYLLKSLAYFDDVPTYTMKTYDIENYLISETLPMELAQAMNKMKCLDNSLDLPTNGYYYHVLTRSLQ